MNVHSGYDGGSTLVLEEAEVGRIFVSSGDCSALYRVEASITTVFDHRVRITIPTTKQHHIIQ